MKVRIANNKNIQTMEQKDIDIYEILKMKSTVQNCTRQNAEGCGIVEWQTTRTVRKQSGLRTEQEENTFSTRTENL